ncbi:MAG TPA: hypothetical protein P5298_10910 [Spirochaetia bacterium]|nr:hypothetical protein [Spirochaetia bacterium]
MKRYRKRSFVRKKVATISAAEMMPASMMIFHEKSIVVLSRLAACRSPRRLGG